MHWLAQLHASTKQQLASGLLIFLLLLAATCFNAIAQQRSLARDTHEIRITQYKQAFTGWGYAQPTIRETYAMVQRVAVSGTPQLVQNECNDTCQATKQLTHFADSLQRSTAQFNV